MLIIKKITYDELQERLFQETNVETIDLGAVMLHVVSGRALLIENPAGDDDSAEVVLRA